MERLFHLECEKKTKRFNTRFRERDKDTQNERNTLICLLVKVEQAKIDSNDAFVLRVESHNLSGFFIHVL